MFDVNKYTHDIKISRGDSGGIELDFIGADLATTDKVVFSVKKAVDDTDALIEIEAAYISENKYGVDINPAHTKALDFGSYFWDTRVFSGTDVYTAEPPHKFEILEVVTNNQ